jgi:hypothetical protein
MRAFRQQVRLVPIRDDSCIATNSTSIRSRHRRGQAPRDVSGARAVSTSFHRCRSDHDSGRFLRFKRLYKDDPSPCVHGRTSSQGFQVGGGAVNITSECRLSGCSSVCGCCPKKDCRYRCNYTGRTTATASFWAPPADRVKPHHRTSLAKTGPRQARRSVRLWASPVRGTGT